MADSYDVIVIGGGIAGASAALAARAAGASVALIRSAPGATAVTSGGWRGPMPAVVAHALRSAGLPYVPVTHPLPHTFGDLRQYDFAAESHAGAFAVPGGVLCGISGLSGFSAPALARLFASATNPPLSSATVAIDGTPPDGWAPHALAGALGRDPDILAQPLLAELPAGASHVVLPAVLGIEDGPAVRAALERGLGIPVFEALGAPPSIPGWRLDRALMRAVANAGTAIITGTAHAVARRTADPRDSVLAGLRIDTSAGARTLAAARYILATGKFIGGGIEALQHRLTESALDLPVWLEHLDQSFTTADALTLTSRVRTYDQPLLKAGVHVNDALHPLDARDRVLYDNVTAAGAVIAGRDCASLGLGEAAAQGVRAAGVAALGAAPAALAPAPAAEIR